MQSQTQRPHHPTHLTLGGGLPSTFTTNGKLKVRARLWLFLKSGKIPGLLCIGNWPKYGPLRDFRHVPSAYQPRAQMSNHGRACTLGVLLYIRGTVTRTQCLLRCSALKWGSPTPLGWRFSMQFLCVVHYDFFFFSISTVRVIIQRFFECNIYHLHDPTC